MLKIDRVTNSATIPADSAESLGEIAGYELARRDFHHFLSYVKIMEPPPGRGLISFELWPHLVEICDLLETEQLIVWLKARHIGATWLCAAYALWTAQYHAGAQVPLISRGDREAAQFLEKCRTIHNHLPEGLKEAIGRDNQSEMEFPRIASAILALPSTEHAGRSSSGSLVIMDEADYHEYFEAHYNAVKPIIDDNGGQLLIISTSNYDKKDTLFKTIYRGAPGNHFKKVFYGWRVRPNRDQAWYERRREEYPDKARFEKEYPNSDIQALAVAQVLAAFNHERLNVMMEQCKSPVETHSNGLIKIYQKGHIGGRYVAATDTSHGTSYDYAVTVVLDAVTGYVAADIMSNTLAPVALAEQSLELLRQFHSPLWVIEDNDWGRVTLQKAIDLQYPRLYHRHTRVQRTEGPPGWHTAHGNRSNLWADLVEAVDEGLLTIPDRDGLVQCYDVIRNPDEEGRIEAQKGSHDDYPMAVGLAWQVRHQATPYRSVSEGHLHRESSLALRRW